MGRTQLGMGSMRVIKTKDPREAQRCRLAQYLGLPKKIVVSGSTFYGVVRSVTQDAGPLWIITFMPADRKKTDLFKVSSARGKATSFIPAFRRSR
jgi:hypothetical protein